MHGLIPRSFIDELLNQVDIVDFIDGFIPLKKRGASHLACCPFHQEKSPSFNVSASKQLYHCFGCGASGNVISFAMQYLQQSFPEAIETLAARVGMQVPRDSKGGDLTSRLSLYQLMQQVAQFYQQMLKTNGSEAIAYLKQRGISGAIARRYQLGYAPEGWHILDGHFKNIKSELLTTGMLVKKEDGQVYDRYRHRIMYPIHDRHGHIIGFGGRCLNDQHKPKYLNSPETILFQKNRELYGLYQLISQKIDYTYIVVVEGYMDVIALAQHDIPQVVATLGTATSTYHIQLLSKYTKEIVFCFDGDSAGQQAAWRALENSLIHLEGGLNARFAFLPIEHDPDSFIREKGKAAFIHFMDNAIPFNQFFIKTLLDGLDGSSLAGKTELIARAKPYLIKMQEGPSKELLVDELVRLTRIEHHRILQFIGASTNHINSDDRPKQASVSRAPIHIAIALLLQQPEIHSGEIPFFSTDDSMQQLLQQLMAQIQENPSISTGHLIELWRDTPWFEMLNTLAAWDHQVPKEAQRNEFKEILLFINKLHHENKIQILIEKSRNMGLTETERCELQSLLQERHHIQSSRIKPTTLTRD